MIHRMPLLATAVLLMGFQQAAPPARAPLPPISSDVIVSPEWEIAPQLAYPSLAASNGIEAGRVVLRCDLIQRRLKHCEAVSEEPKAQGFGEAAVAGITLGLITESWANRLEPGTAVFLPLYFRLD